MAEDYGVITYTRLSEEIRQAIDEWARREQRSTAAQIAVILERAVSEHQSTSATPKIAAKAAK